MIRWKDVLVGYLIVLILLLLQPVCAWSQTQETEGSKEPTSVEERRIRYAVEKERAQLQAEYKKRREILDMKDFELKTLAQEVDKKIEELQRLKDELQAIRMENQAELSQRAKELSRIIEKMEPAQAATLIAKLDESLAVLVLSGLKPKSAGRLLNNLNTVKAAELSTAYSEQIRKKRP